MLRRLIASIGAVLTGLANTVMNANRSRIQLAPGDPAPDFTLAGSDGRTYRLQDFAGNSAVVLAWFPKAFTGG
jgi:peroxiredoxin Q/BCP